MSAGNARAVPFDMKPPFGTLTAECFNVNFENHKAQINLIERPHDRKPCVSDSCCLCLLSTCGGLLGTAASEDAAAALFLRSDKEQSGQGSALPPCVVADVLGGDLCVWECIA